MEVEREDEGGVERGAGGRAEETKWTREFEKASQVLLLRTQGPPNTRKQLVK